MWIMMPTLLSYSDYQLGYPWYLLPINYYIARRYNLDFEKGIKTVRNEMSWTTIFSKDSIV